VKKELESKNRCLNSLFLKSISIKWDIPIMIIRQKNLKIPMAIARAKIKRVNFPR